MGLSLNKKIPRVSARLRPLALALALLCACGDSGLLRIAAFLPVGAEAERQGIELALREIDAREGMRVVVQFYPCASGKAAKKPFAELKKTTIALAIGSEIAASLAPLAEAQGIPLIGLSVPGDGFTKGKRWVFRNSVTREEEQRALTELIDFLDLRRVYIAESGESQFVAGFAKKLLERNIAADILAGGAVPANSGAILFPEQNHESLSNAVYRCREQGYAGKIIARKILPGQPFGAPIYGIAPGGFRSRVGLAGRIFDIFQTQYGKEMTLDAALAYDAIIMLSKILVSDEPDPESARAALDAEFVYPSFLGIRSSPAGEHDFVPRLFPVLLRPDETIEYLEEELEPGDLLR